MTRHVLLNNVSHKHLRIDPRYDTGCGFDHNIARAFPVELGILQAEYPLFFLKNAESGHFDPVALLGFEEGENLFLGGDRWLARAQPLSIQRQPFLIGFQEQLQDGIPERVPVVTVDMDDPSVSEERGEPVFLPHGGDSPLLERVNSILATIHAGHEAAATLSRVLVGLDLIEPFRLDITFEDESRHSVTGLHRIDETRLDALDGGALQTLHDAGHLRSVYMMLASLPNLETLIERKNRKLTA